MGSSCREEPSAGPKYFLWRSSLNRSFKPFSAAPGTRRGSRFASYNEQALSCERKTTRERMSEWVLHCAVSDKVSRRILSRDRGMIVWWGLGAGVYVEPHSHASEQIVCRQSSFGPA
jgi:hypothetical protein